MEAGGAFGVVAAEYDRVRPGYPDELVDSACRRAGLKPGSRVLEVGCGTGKLTTALAERGVRVDAVDPSAALVDIARRKPGGDRVRFHLGTFEEVDLPPGRFDAVFSATAFHWVDPAVGWSKVARLLRPGGLLALLSHLGGGFLDFEPAFWRAWREVRVAGVAEVKHRPETFWAGVAARRDNISELWELCHLHSRIAVPEAATLFHDVRFAVVETPAVWTAAEVLALLRTQSAYLRLGRVERAALERRITGIVDRAGGGYPSPLYALLATARRA